MTDETTDAGRSASTRAGDGCPLRARYLALTLALAASQLWAFAASREVYPVAAWPMMSAGGGLGRGHDYFILRGETVAGEIVDVPPAQLTDALYSRTWGLVERTVRNGPFRLRRLHPENAALLDSAGGFDRLPRAARLPELLRAWGGIHNEQLPADSPRRLRALRLEAYRWDGRGYGDYQRFVESWRVEL